MKKLLAILLMTALLLSAFCVPVFAADGDKPLPTSGPWDGYYWMTGGPMISFVGGSAGQHVERLVYYRESMMMSSSPMIIDNEAVPGATYDKSANTLTLDNVKLTDNLGVYYMGDDFKLRVEGECELKKISVFNFAGKYSTSLNITGTGALTLNKDKTYSEAIEFYSEGISLTHLDIAPSATVHLYSAQSTDEEFPQNVADINSTYADPAITVGGKAIPEAKSERRVETVSETVNALWVENPDHVYQRGKRVISKTDPDGIYAVQEIEFNTGSSYEPRLCVTKYNHSPFGIDLPDPEFSEEYGDYIILTQDEFEAGYDYVTELQPKKIRYTTEYRERKRGYRGVKFIKDGEPDAVYIGTPGWTTPYDNKLGEIDTYCLYSAQWDETEQLYVAERSAVEKYKTAEELAAKGYTVVTEPFERRAMLDCWENPAPYDDDNNQDRYQLIARNSEPGSLYVYMGKTYSGGAANAVLVSPVHYDEENDVYYLNGDEDTLEIAIADWESDHCDFVYMTEKGEKGVEVQYIDSGYTFDNYSSEGFLLTKDGDPGKFYVADLVTGTDGRKQYFVSDFFTIEWREDKGHYYLTAPGEFVFGDLYDDVEEMEADGWHMVLEDQPVDYTVTGSVQALPRPLYQDSQGNRYFYDFDNNLNSISEDNTFSYGGEEYYIGTPAEGVNEDDLQAVEHDEICDDDKWWIEGTEYHHIGTGEEAGILGDVDSDGNVEIRDATWIQRYVSVIEIPFTITKTTADTDGDDEITVMDATYIQRWLASLKSNDNIGKLI